MMHMMHMMHMMQERLPSHLVRITYLEVATFVRRRGVGWFICAAHQCSWCAGWQNYNVEMEKYNTQLLVSRSERALVLNGQLSMTIMQVVMNGERSSGAHLSLSGRTIDPFWCTSSPRTSRRAKLRTCVKVWLGRMRCRRVLSTRHVTVSPTLNAPLAWPTCSTKPAATCDSNMLQVSNNSISINNVSNIDNNNNDNNDTDDSNNHNDSDDNDNDDNNNNGNDINTCHL